MAAEQRRQRFQSLHNARRQLVAKLAEAERLQAVWEREEREKEEREQAEREKAEQERLVKLPTDSSSEKGIGAIPSRQSVRSSLGGAVSVGSAVKRSRQAFIEKTLVESEDDQLGNDSVESDAVSNNEVSFLDQRRVVSKLPRSVTRRRRAKPRDRGVKPRKKAKVIRAEPREASVPAEVIEEKPKSERPNIDQLKAEIRDTDQELQKLMETPELATVSVGAVCVDPPPMSPDRYQVGMFSSLAVVPLERYEAACSGVATQQIAIAANS